WVTKKALGISSFQYAFGCKAPRAHNAPALSFEKSQDEINKPLACRVFLKRTTGLSGGLSSSMRSKRKRNAGNAVPG
ncbi:MAG TPA: hypothetical protein PLZ53_05520, partial [Candidatus Hydrogenedentes bacterium]|nr:hypothetical protein [Candidatus Hydrogenedentota bacterium]